MGCDQECLTEEVKWPLSSESGVSLMEGASWLNWAEFGGLPT